MGRLGEDGAVFPTKREALVVRNVLDAEDEKTEAVRRSPAQGLLEVVEVSELVRGLALASGASALDSDDLAQKSRLSPFPFVRCFSDDASARKGTHGIHRSARRGGPALRTYCLGDGARGAVPVERRFRTVSGTSKIS